MATRGGMIMVFREGMVIYGTHRNHFSKSRPPSGLSSPARSPRNITPTRSGSITPPVYRTKDGSVVEKRLPKIPSRDQIFMNSSSFENPNSNVPKRKTSRTVNEISSQSSSEIASAPKSSRHVSHRASLEVKPFKPILAGPSSSESSSTTRLLKTSESKGALEPLIEHSASIPKAERMESAKEPAKMRLRSQSERAKSCKQCPQEPMISSGEIGFKKSVSSPLSASEKRRRKTKTIVPELELIRTESSSRKGSSSTKSQSSSSTMMSSPRTDSGSNTSPRSFNTSPRSYGESPKHNPSDQNYSAETSPRSINSANSSGSNSRQSSPRSVFEASFYKNVDINVQLELEDLILIVIPNQDVDVSVVLDMYLSAPDKLAEIDHTKFSTVGQLVLLKVMEPMEQPRLDRRRPKRNSTPDSAQYGSELGNISQESHT